MSANKPNNGGTRLLGPRKLSKDALEFSSSLLAIQESPPARIPRAVLYVVCSLFGILLIWAIFGDLDIIASAEGRLVPQTYVKIVQPAESGILQAILVVDGEHVLKGQVLMRMDSQTDQADENTLQTELGLRSLQLRRIDAEMGGNPLSKHATDPDGLYAQVESQYRERRRAYNDALGQAGDSLKKSQHDYDAGSEILSKLQQVAPILEQQAVAYESMGLSGFISQIQVRDKKREYLEKLQDLKAQRASEASLASGVAAAQKQMLQVSSKYRSELQNERVDAEGHYRKTEQELAKADYKIRLLELRAPQGGIVKDLATHTVGTVVTPGAVLLSLVPDRDPLVAEVMVKNEDIGFIFPHQKVKIKLQSFPFQQYGMLDGEILSVAADSTSGVDSQNPSKNAAGSTSTSGLIYKAVVSLSSQHIVAENKRHFLIPGMQVVAEIDEGKRSVMKYLLSPLQKAANESGRER